MNERTKKIKFRLIVFVTFQQEMNKENNKSTNQSK